MAIKIRVPEEVRDRAREVLRLADERISMVKDDLLSDDYVPGFSEYADQLYRDHPGLMEKLEPAHTPTIGYMAMLHYQVALRAEAFLSDHKEATGLELDFDMLMLSLEDARFHIRYREGRLDQDYLTRTQWIQESIETFDTYTASLDMLQEVEIPYFGTYDKLLEHVHEQTPKMGGVDYFFIFGSESAEKLRDSYMTVAVGSRSEEELQADALEQYATLIEAVGGDVPKNLESYLPLRMTGIEYDSTLPKYNIATFHHRVLDVLPHADTFSALAREEVELRQQVLSHRKADAKAVVQAFDLADEPHTDYYGHAVADRMVRLGAEKIKDAMEDMQQRNQAMRDYLDTGRLPLANRVAASQGTGAFRG